MVSTSRCGRDIPGSNPGIRNLIDAITHGFHSLLLPRYLSALHGGGVISHTVAVPYTGNSPLFNTCINVTSGGAIARSDSYSNARQKRVGCNYTACLYFCPIILTRWRMRYGKPAYCDSIVIVAYSRTYKSSSPLATAFLGTLS